MKHIMKCVSFSSRFNVVNNIENNQSEGCIKFKRTEKNSDL